MMFGEEVHVRPFQIPNSRFQYRDSLLQIPRRETHFTAKILHRQGSFHASSFIAKILHPNSFIVGTHFIQIPLPLQVFSLLKSCCNIGVLFWNLESGIWNLESWNLGILEFYSYEAWLYHSP